MAQPTPETLLEKALAKALEFGSRNKAGFWLAHQLHANGYSVTDAESIMRDYVRSVPHGDGRKDYTEREALSTLKSEYRRQAAEPWGNASNVGERQRDRRQAREPEGYKPKPERQADPEGWKRYQANLRNLQPLKGSPSVTYLKGRGIPLEVAIDCKVKHCPDWYGRPAVIFPFTDPTGKAVAACGRYIDGKNDPKTRTGGMKALGAFLTPGAMDGDSVIVTEAAIDAMSLAVCGFPAVATGGISLPDWFARSCVLKAVYIATDNDEAGERAARVWAAEIGAFTSKCYRLRPPSKDWNECLQRLGIEGLTDLLVKAIPSDFDPFAESTAQFAQLEPEADTQPETVLEAVLRVFPGATIERQ